MARRDSAGQYIYIIYTYTIRPRTTHTYAQCKRVWCNRRRPSSVLRTYKILYGKRRSKDVYCCCCCCRCCCFWRCPVVGLCLLYIIFYIVRIDIGTAVGKRIITIVAVVSSRYSIETAASRPIPLGPHTLLRLYSDDDDDDGSATMIILSYITIIIGTYTTTSTHTI